MKSSRFLSIDAMRGVACLCVVVLHIYNFSDLPKDGSLGARIVSFFSLWGVGVTVFIVLSGFCIHLSVAKQMQGLDSTKGIWVRFWRRRFVRLYPPYLAAIVLSTAVLVLVCTLRTPRDSPEIRGLHCDVVLHLFMVHNLFDGFNQGLCNGPLWSLGLEEQLYAFYMLFIFFRSRVRVRYIALAAFLLSQSWNLAIRSARMVNCLQGLGPSGSLALGEWRAWPFSYLFIWLLGALCAEAYLGNIAMRRWLVTWRSASLFGCVWLALSWVQGNYDPICTHITGAVLQSCIHSMGAFTDLAAALATVCVINCCLAREAKTRLTNRAVTLLAGIGVFSYSLYLTHVPVMHLGELVLPLTHSWESACWRLVLYLPFTLGFAYLFFVTVERRVLHRSGGTAVRVSFRTYASPGKPNRQTSLVGR